MNSSNIRNFSIIAHIDHGKSTLADRILEITGSVEKRKMKEQLLDSMELERERGITIKMQPVRMKFKDHVLNLIDTPGHIDFNYEVSRALKAVEGAVLLVDATQGVQAQTITNVEMAKCLGLVIIPVLNKIDLPTARIDEVKKEVMEFLECGEEEVLQVSGKTGAGVEELLSEIVKRVPPPKEEISSGARAIVFDFEYSLHQGMIVYVRVTDGEIKKGDQLKLYQAGEIFSVGEIGFFSPEKKPADSLSAGEIGYIVTAIKKASIGTVGDTVVSVKEPLSPLGGYMQPKPVVWASIYPESQEDLAEFRRSLERLKLSDSSLSFEEEQSGSMGRGFRCGFLGMLHLEIVIERLKREFNLNLVVAMPTITYKVLLMDDKEVEIYSPNLLPEENLIKKVFEQWVDMQIIIPPDRLAALRARGGSGRDGAIRQEQKYNKR